MSRAESLAETLSDRWRSCVYTFFKAEVTIKVVDGRRALEFRCAAKHCRIGTPVRRYLDKGDRSSSGNLLKHAKSCWGAEAVLQAKQIGDVTRVRNTLVANILKNGCITEYFAPAKRSVTYSNRPLSRVQIRFEFVRWVSESYRPFAVATDPGFLRLMKTGRPGMYIPSPTTISRDVKITFAGGRCRLAAMLRAYPGRLHFATDAWTAPNHRPFVAFTVHLEVEGATLSIILDIVELAKVRTWSPNMRTLWWC
ncbi:hypothetical protein C8T65DRAFT_582743 [Cerioporus squamosus]|nr:hypothetical protein C8T65DRAFT_582743 [Cerioporus squamosus]